MEVEGKIQEILKALPETPGVYRFYDEKQSLLYVGKAKNLKHRVSSYFHKQHHDSGRIRLMVKLVRDIQIMVVETELDALLLENNLIKEQKPRFNVMLRDDKTYPWICITNEPFPRVFPTRRKLNDQDEYFGPYASIKMMRNVLDLIKQLYPLRSCRLQLQEKAIREGKFKVCLEYHLGNCKAPCVGLQEEVAYQLMIQDIREIIRGRTGSLIRLLKSRMIGHAEKYEYEQAQDLKERIAMLEQYRSKSVVVGQDVGDCDVFTVAEEGSHIYVNYLQVIEGAVVQGHTLDLKRKMEETPEEILALAIFELRRKFKSTAKELVVDRMPEVQIPGLKYHVAQRGDKKMLLDLSNRNLRFHIQDQWSRMAIKDPEAHTMRVLETMQKDLRLPKLPHHIECFDNSNFQGSFPVSAMVLFRDGKPSKKEYRHYNVKTVEGPNDFATMEEVLTRRYGRCIEENEPLPDLVVVDGGKGQLSAAVAVFDALGLRGKVSLIGIAKRLEEIYFPGDPLPLYIDKRSESLKVIQHMRNEAHRFGITHYRSRHRKALTKSALEDIPGVGSATIEKLMKEFKSVKRLREAKVEDIGAVIGQKKAEVVVQFLLDHP